jgi:hypothetical protein
MDYTHICSDLPAYAWFRASRESAPEGAFSKVLICRFNKVRWDSPSVLASQSALSACVCTTQSSVGHPWPVRFTALTRRTNRGPTDPPPLNPLLTLLLKPPPLLLAQAPAVFDGITEGGMINMGWHQCGCLPSCCAYESPEGAARVVATVMPPEKGEGSEAVAVYDPHTGDLRAMWAREGEAWDYISGVCAYEDEGRVLLAVLTQTAIIIRDPEDFLAPVRTLTLRVPEERRAEAVDDMEGAFNTLAIATATHGGRRFFAVGLEAKGRVVLIDAESGEVEATLIEGEMANGRMTLRVCQLEDGREVLLYASFWMNVRMWDVTPEDRLPVMRGAHKRG